MPAGSSGDPYPDTLLVALGEEMVRMSRRRINVHDGALLEGSAFRILSRLTRDPRTLRDLAEDLRLEQSTVSRQVNAAITRGLIERFDDDTGCRRIRPTRMGQEAFEHDGRLRAEVIRRALAALGPERARALVADLQVFNDALDHADAHVPERS